MDTTTYSGLRSETEQSISHLSFKSKVIPHFCAVDDVPNHTNGSYTVEITVDREFFTLQKIHV